MIEKEFPQLGGGDLQIDLNGKIIFNTKLKTGLDRE